MKRALLALAATAAGLLGASASTADASTPAPARTSAGPNVAVQWNQFLLGLQATAGDQPATVHPTYELALMHAALDDAVVAIDGGSAPYAVAVHGPRRASDRAAADAAAHDTLVALYPGLKASIDGEYATLLTQVQPGLRRAEGVLVGRTVARRLLARRAHDGSAAAPLPFTPGGAPGDYQLTPPAFGPPVFTHWAAVRPFALRRADQFRPGPPPALTSRRYARAINQVKTLGVAAGSSRTDEQTQIGLFWNPPIWATWNRIAENAALARPHTLPHDARTFAVLNLTLADSVIGLYDAKYAYTLWRPVTAVRAADTDGNPATTTDPAWTPLSNTAPDPSYPGAHATVSAAAARVLTSVYGGQVPFTIDSPALPGVTRHFRGFSQAATEATVSRIYNGNHTRIDEAAGRRLGRHVARFVLGHELRAGTR